MGMRIRRRRHELHNIRALGDVNELSISGHVEHPSVPGEDHDGERVYEFVLTHTTLSLSGRWEHQHYTVQAYGQLGEHYASTWLPGQTTIVEGRLEYQTRDKAGLRLDGPLPSVWIVAHCIDDTLGPHPHREDNG
jgi:hypothetical protein